MVGCLYLTKYLLMKEKDCFEMQIILLVKAYVLSSYIA